MNHHIVKHYQNGDLKITWEPEKCIHAGICARELPQVFRPQERPWVHAEEADPDTLAAQIDRCPTGALSYERTSGQPTLATDASHMEILEDGPIIMTGPLEIDYRGEKTQVPEGKKVAICRCGASGNKPLCDGTHKKIDWKG